MGEVRCSWLKKSKVGSNVSAPVFKWAVSSKMKEKSLATDIGREAW